MVLFTAVMNGDRNNPATFGGVLIPGIDDDIDCAGFTVSQSDDRDSYQIDPNGGIYQINSAAGDVTLRFKDTSFPSGPPGFLSGGAVGWIQMLCTVNKGTMTSVTAGAPTNYWVLDSIHSIKLRSEFVIEKFTNAVWPNIVNILGADVGIFQDNKPSATEGLHIEATATLANCDGFISRRIYGYGLLVTQNVTKGVITKWVCDDAQGYTWGTGNSCLVELENCSFDGSNCYLDYIGAGSGRGYSYTHNLVATEMGLILEQGENFSMVADWHVTGYVAGNLIYVFVRAGGTHAHFRHDVATLISGYRLQLGAKGDYVFDTLGGLQVDGPMLQCHRLITAGGGAAAGTIQKILDTDEVTFQDHNDCEIDVAAGTINILGRSPLTGIIQDFLVVRHMDTQVEQPVALPKGITVTSGGAGGTLYLHHSRLHHAKNVMASSTLKIWDAEYWWTPSTDPEEVYIPVGSTWDLKRWKIATYAKRWYVKNDGTVLTNNTMGFFDHLVPSIYNAAYYIAFFKGPWTADTQPWKKVWAKAHHRGGRGEYFEDLGWGSKRCNVQGRMSDTQRALWGTPLYHRMFIAKLYELDGETLAGGNAIFQFFWHEGYIDKCIMEKFDWYERAGQDATVQSQIYSMMFAAAPYN